MPPQFRQSTKPQGEPHAFIRNTLTQRPRACYMATPTTPLLHGQDSPRSTQGIGSQRPENLEPAKMTPKTTYPHFRDYPQGQTPANPHGFRRPQKSIQLSIFLNIFIYIGVFIYMCAHSRKLDKPCKPCSLKAFCKNDRYLDTFWRTLAFMRSAGCPSLRIVAKMHGYLQP